MIKITSAIALFLLLYCRLLPAQQPLLEWAVKYPDTNTFIAGASCMALDSIGNVYVGGWGDSGYCTVKYLPTGVRQWAVKYPGPISIGNIKDIAVDRLANVYVTGYVNAGGANFNYCTIKYNTEGIQQWVRIYDGPASSYDEAHQIGIDNTGNIYVSGFSSLFGGFTFQITTIKYLPDGTEVWVRRYGNPDSGTYLDGLSIDEFCNVYLTGAQNDKKATTIKYDSSGSLIWDNWYPVTSRAYDICLDINNNVYVTGWTDEGPSAGDFLTIKYSSIGVQQWARRYNPDSLANNSHFTANSIAVDKAGNIYVSGSFKPIEEGTYKLLVLKYSSGGELIWLRKDKDSLSLGLNANLYNFIDMDSSNSIYAACSYRLSNSPFDSSSYTVIKYDTSGNLLWKAIYKSNGTIFPFELIVKNYSVYVSGNGVNRMLTLKYSQPLAIQPISNFIPNEYKLYPSFPNPFNPITNIRFDLPHNLQGKGVNANLIVYDVLGREIEILVKQMLKPGTYEVEWNAKNYPSGIYFYRLTTDNFRETKRMILLK